MTDGLDGDSKVYARDKCRTDRHTEGTTTLGVGVGVEGFAHRNHSRGYPNVRPGSACPT
jgi:hypothetical protein